MEVIAGIDEVGRGCWAGPLVACAAVLNMPVEGLKDSKQLSAKQRHKLAAELKTAASYGLGWVWPREVDQLGLTAAVSLAMERAVDGLETNYTSIIIDGNYNYLPKLANVTTLVKADDLVPAVSAASIIAKVARDTYMYQLALKEPRYGFEKHVGYGTKTHQQALANYGPSIYHRHSFKPVKAQTTSFDIGRRAEQAATDYLKSKGYSVIECNWRTQWCEVDIVATQNNLAILAEVKYRRTNVNGTGTDYITSSKLRQMTKAAESWVKATSWLGDYSLAVVEVSGPTYQITNFSTDVLASS